MARKPFKIRENKDTISITFNKEGWKPIHTKMLESYVDRFAKDDTIQGSKPAELVGNAFGLESLSRNGFDTFRRFMDMLEAKVKKDQAQSKLEP